jgi:hypothetical protein
LTYNNTEGLDVLLSNKEFKVEIHNKPYQEELKELIKGIISGNTISTA